MKSLLTHSGFAFLASITMFVPFAPAAAAQHASALRATLDNADSLPVGLIVTHTPSEVRAEAQDAGEFEYIWRFATHVRAIGSPVRITEFGAYEKRGDTWVFTNVTGQPYTGPDFESWYGCKDGLVDAVRGATDPNNWQQRRALVVSTNKWIYVGVDASGRAVKGEAIVHCLGDDRVVPIAPGTRAVTPPFASASAPGPSLKGTVRTSRGAALRATVFIARAAPKSGTSTLCPSCYVDCAKRATTDAAGAFHIDSLATELTFEVLAVAKGYQPRFVSGVDPATSTVNIVLDPIESTRAKADRSVRGRVVDTNGAPIEGAVVEVQGVAAGPEGTTWGTIRGVDPCAVSDERGEFLLTARKPFHALSVSLSARGFADRPFNDLAPGTKPAALEMTEGAALKGRVLSGGKPLGGVLLGVSGVNRRAGFYAGHFEVGTDRDGVFLFTNLPPSVDLFLYGLMESMRPHGAIDIRRVRSGNDGAMTDVGDLVVVPAHRLAGRIVLSDGRSVPEGTQLLVCRENAWDMTQLTLDESGQFEVTGIPSETISLNLHLTGYHLSARNVGLDMMGMSLTGRVDQDITDLLLLLEEGDDQPMSMIVSPNRAARPASQPLEGAERAAGDPGTSP